MITDTDVQREISAEEIQRMSHKGQFYNHKTENWKTLSTLKWLLRRIFGWLPCLDSISRTCMRRSWEAIEDMPHTPLSISKNIENYFRDSRSKYHPLNPVSFSITKIYSKAILKQDNSSSPSSDNDLKSFQINQDPQLRFFRILDGKKLLNTAFNSQYAKIDFYNAENEKIAENFHDVLYEKDLRSACIRKQQIYWGKDKHLAVLEAEGDRRSFMFRDSKKNLLLAIATWDTGYSPRQLQNWSVTIIDKPLLKKRKINHLLLAWALLKHSQKFLQGPQDLPYIANPISESS